jgi:hypothetical protein
MPDAGYQVTQRQKQPEHRKSTPYTQLGRLLPVRSQMTISDKLTFGPANGWVNIR